MNLDPHAIWAGLCDGSIRITAADEIERTPLVNAYIRQINDIFEDHYRSLCAAPGCAGCKPEPVNTCRRPEGGR